MIAARLLVALLLVALVIVPATQLAITLAASGALHTLKDHRVSSGGWRSGVTAMPASVALPVLTERDSVVVAGPPLARQLSSDPPFVPPRG